MSGTVTIFERVEKATTPSVVIDGLNQAFGDSGRAQAMNWLITGNGAYNGQAPVDFMATDPENVPVVASDVAKVLRGSSLRLFSNCIVCRGDNGKDNNVFCEQGGRSLG